MKGEKELKIQRLARSQAENRLSIFDNKSDLIEREVRLPTLMYAPGTPKKQSPWAVVDLGSTLDRLSGAANTCLLVKVSPQLAGPRVLLCASACKMLQGGPGAGGGVWTIIRQKGRPVTPLTQQRWSEPWVAILWCFSLNNRLLATPFGTPVGCLVTMQ